MSEADEARAEAERVRWILSADRKDAEAEAERMWPEEIQLGRWDGIKITAERALLIQRQAFEMGAGWLASRPITDEQVEAAFASILETARDVTTKDDVRAALEAARGVQS